ncbi:MAG TPA: hypothetical protein DGG94_12640 [Micromonosporaceae bacterium]|nr:hypothetical protein [Micromonosporaceae bacterium]HCU50628.1 hypothetical protein [Micromonosporaceae bacterium]
MLAAAGFLWGAGLATVGTRLNRIEARGRIWRNATVFATVLAAGSLTGSGLLDQLIMTAALNDAPQFFADLVRGSIGQAQTLPFLIFNPALEWLLIPAVVLFNWREPRRRRLLLALFVIFYLNRVWTHTWFVPQITSWSEGASGTPMSVDQLEQARHWVMLSWIRLGIDVAAVVLALLVAFIPLIKRDQASNRSAAA